jgi:hypothetical protein
MDRAGSGQRSKEAEGIGLRKEGKVADCGALKEVHEEGRKQSARGQQVERGPEQEGKGARRESKQEGEKCKRLASKKARGQKVVGGKRAR